MWFKNLHVYRVPQYWTMPHDTLAAHLVDQVFKPLGDYELASHGWVAPRHDELVHAVQGQLLLTLCTEKRLLPGHVVNRLAKQRADELAESQGYRPGKKSMKEIKERAFDELLPRAFKQEVRTNLWIDRTNGWLVVDTASKTRADIVIKMLLRSIDKLPLESLLVARSPMASMTNWVNEDEAPYGFTVDQDAVLQASGESKATVKYNRHTLDAGEMQRHIAAGKQVKSLALTWDDKISFVMKADMTIARIKPLDILTTNDPESRDQDERFDNDFYLMASELNRLLGDLIQAFGGQADRSTAATTTESKP